MRAVKRSVGACVLLVLLAGCAAPPMAPGGVPGAPTTGVPSVAPVAVSADPAACTAPQPARADPFPFNRDAARRDAVLGVGGTYLGGVESFENLDATKLGWLIAERYADPYDTQNAAPSVWEIFRFLCAHPKVRAAGYVVSIERDDYRTSIEDIYASAPDATLKADARAFCAEADESTFDGRLECFWD
nr:hypothetical protein GCM10020063_039030 [Dactylosporangium thailandense]